MLIVVVAGLIANRHQFVRYTIVTRDRDVALSLRKNAADHQIRMVGACWINVTTGFCRVGECQRRRKDKQQYGAGK
jgi:hypothetical protein